MPAQQVLNRLKETFDGTIVRVDVPSDERQSSIPVAVFFAPT